MPSPRFHHQHNKKKKRVGLVLKHTWKTRMVVHVYLISALERWRKADLMFKVIHLSLPNSEFKASLDYMSPCLKKQTQTNC